MFGIGGSEFVIIAVFALLLFGPDKIPQFARQLGKLMADFKRYQETMESAFRAEMYGEDSDEPKLAGEAPAVPAYATEEDEADEEEEE